MKSILQAIRAGLCRQVRIALPRMEELYSVLPWDIAEVFVNFALVAIWMHQACFEIAERKFVLYRLMYRAFPPVVWVGAGLFLCIMQFLSVLLIIPRLRRRLIQAAALYLAVVGGLMLIANPTNLVSWLTLIFAIMAAGAARRLKRELGKGIRNARPEH